MGIGFGRRISRAAPVTRGLWGHVSVLLFAMALALLCPGAHGIGDTSLAFSMHFEGSLEVVHRTNAHTYTVTSDPATPTYVPDGKAGQALRLSRGEWVCIDSGNFINNKLTGTGDWSISFWLRNHAYNTDSSSTPSLRS